MRIVDHEIAAHRCGRQFLTVDDTVILPVAQ
jgi:hypothetical protein